MHIVSNVEGQAAAGLGRQDVLKAMALGAKGTLIGRPHLYGLGAMGEAGVTKALEIIRPRVGRVMALCGYNDIRDVNREILLPGTFPQGAG